MSEADPGENFRPDTAAATKAYAVYTPASLLLYDFIVHRLSDRLAWQCRREELVALYRRNVSRRHLEAGVGTGSLLAAAGADAFERLVLLDINSHCLQAAQRKLASYNPELRQESLFATEAIDTNSFTSIGLTYVLHCLPGRMEQKLAVVDRLMPRLEASGVLFGATILGRGIEPNRAARALLNVYNEKGIFNNRDDDLESLASGLRRRFAEVEIAQTGCVALFRAIKHG